MGEQALNAAFFIDKLGLEKHPEGGYFKEVYRSNEVLEKLPKRFTGQRNIATSIYFLLNGNDKSHFHKIKSDETWHFYQGSSICIHMIDSDGNYSKALVGNNLNVGEQFQFTVPKNVWFAAELIDKSSFGLCGCSVAPGFDFADFELAKANELHIICPNQSELIKEFCLA